jgi:hypothetical protein
MSVVNEETGEIIEPVEPVEPDESSPDEEEEAADDDEAAPVEPDEEVPHAGPVTDEEQAVVFDKAIKRAKTYMSAIPLILGDSAQELALCPRCTDFIPGFTLPLNLKPVSDEQKVAVKLSIGELSAPEYRPDSSAEVCNSCDGYGKVSTGSLVPTQAVLQCRRCSGRGWVGPRADSAPTQAQTLAPGNGFVVDDAVEPKPVMDPWGRAIDDPLYGVMPGFERD